MHYCTRNCKINNLVAIYTLSRREIIRIIRIWPQTVFSPVINILIYTLLFGKLMGEIIGPMQGFSYLHFILPGLIMMAIINNSYANVAWSFFTVKFENCIEELLVAPFAERNIILGYVIGGVVRGLSVGLIVVICCKLTIDFSIASLWLTILTCIFGAILFSLAGLLNGLLAHKFDDLAIVPTYVLAPLIYLSGVFYSLDVLGNFWQTVSYFNPLFYLVNLFRFSILGIADVSINLALVVILFYTITLYIICLYSMNHGMRNYGSIYAKSKKLKKLYTTAKLNKTLCS